MNPEKLRQFSKIELLTNAATKYLHHLVCEEMPVGLKKYMEVELCKVCKIIIHAVLKTVCL